MTLLELVQRHCKRSGLQVPSIVASSTEDQIIQCMELLNEELNDLVPRAKWQALVKTATFTSVATEEQGAIDSIAPGIVNNWIIPQTFWDRTTGTRLHGPLTAEEYAMMAATGSVPVNYPWRIVGGKLLVLGMQAGDSLSFEYLSNLSVRSNVGEDKRYFTLDDDYPLLPDAILLAGLRWRWKREQGLDYAEDFRRYEEAVAIEMGRQGGKILIDAGLPASPKPGICVPEINWSV